MSVASTLLRLDHTAGAVALKHSVKNGVYQKIQEASQKNPNAMRFSGLGIAIASAVFTVIQRIASIVECIFKGIANLFGALFTDKCDAIKGCKQIFLQLPFNLLQFFFIPVEVSIGLVGTTLGMAVKPEEYVDIQIKYHKKMLNFIRSPAMQYLRG